MRRSQAENIAIKAATLAVNVTDGFCEGFMEAYNEYLDQLSGNDYQCLRQWLGWQIEEGNREAVGIMKQLIAAKLAESFERRNKDERGFKRQERQRAGLHGATRRA